MMKKEIKLIRLLKKTFEKVHKTMVKNISKTFEKVHKTMVKNISKTFINFLSKVVLWTFFKSRFVDFF